MITFCAMIFCGSKIATFFCFRANSIAFFAERFRKFWKYLKVIFFNGRFIFYFILFQFARLQNQFVQISIEFGGGGGGFGAMLKLMLVRSWKPWKTEEEHNICIVLCTSFLCMCICTVNQPPCPCDLHALNNWVTICCSSLSPSPHQRATGSIPPPWHQMSITVSTAFGSRSDDGYLSLNCSVSSLTPIHEKQLFTYVLPPQTCSKPNRKAKQERKGKISPLPSSDLSHFDLHNQRHRHYRWVRTNNTKQ